MQERYILIERPPTAEEYLRLRTAAGWGIVEAGSAEKGLGNSLFSVCAEIEDEVIGCGRVIGDGGIYFYIQDVIVMPGAQGRGIGTGIMNSLMRYVKENAPDGSFVGLMAAKGTAEFYRRFGFKERPSDRPGMFMAMS